MGDIYKPVSSKSKLAVLVVGLHEAGRLLSDTFTFSPVEAFKDGSESKLTRPGIFSTLVSGRSLFVGALLLFTESSDLDRFFCLKDSLCLEACSMPSYTLS